jgi:hypothetical protein
MNKYNRSIIRKQILEYAPKMQPLLPPLDAHPNGRGAIPHMYSVLEGVFGCKLAEVRDVRLNDALAILKYTMDNATKMRIMSPLREMYAPEPEPLKPITLDIFFE